MNHVPLQPSIGVTIGKFNPPHLGHLHLVQEAASKVDRLFVVLCERPDQTLSGEERLSWLQGCAPANTVVVLTPDDLPEAPEPWARRTLSLLPHPPDLAFSSEPWGPAWAEHMGASHVMIDQERTTVPISATRIRSDLWTNFRWLVPPARVALARRVVVAGAESTGKSTLAQALAAELQTVWVPEYGRWYWEGRRYQSDQTWASHEFETIATGQTELVNALAQRSTNGLVIVDTDALVTSVWHERYLGYRSDRLDAIAAATRPDLYLVCAPDFEWVQDGTRESRDYRGAMHQKMLSLVEASGSSWVILAGDHDSRLQEAVGAISSVFPIPQLS